MLWCQFVKTDLELSQPKYLATSKGKDECFSLAHARMRRHSSVLLKSTSPAGFITHLTALAAADKRIFLKIDLRFLFVGLVVLHINRGKRRKEKKMVKGLRSDSALPVRRTALWSLQLASVKSVRTSFASLARMLTVKRASQNHIQWKRWRPP